MARRGRRHIVYSAPERDAPSPSLRFLLPVAPRPAPTLPSVEDRRNYHPLGPVRPARTVSGHPVARLKVSPRPPSTKAAFLAHKLKFPDPKRVAICVRRQQRKEVLFALKKTGKGGRAKRRRRNYYSGVSC